MIAPRQRQSHLSKKGEYFDTLTRRVEAGDTSGLVKYGSSYRSSAPVAEPVEAACEGLVQQRLLQRLQRGELPPGEAGEVVGFGGVHGYSDFGEELNCLGGVGELAR